MKQHVLENAGYAYNFDREIYFSRAAKTIFSMDFVEDHDEEEIERLVRDENIGEEWRFHFNADPSESVRRELVRVIG